MQLKKKNICSRLLVVSISAVLTLVSILSGCRTQPQQAIILPPEPSLSQEDLNRAQALALYSYSLMLKSNVADSNQTTQNVEQLLHDATILDPTAQRPLATMLGLLNEEKRYDEALAYAELYLEHNPNDRAITVDAATLADAAGNYTNALKHITTLHKADPDNRDLHEALIKLNFQLEDYPLALHEIRHLHTRFNDSESATYPIHWAVFFVEQEPFKPDVALECTKIALEFNTNAVREAALTALSGECLFLLNQTNNAARAWLNAFAMDPSTLTPLLRVGGLQAILDKPLELNIPPADQRTTALLEAATHQAKGNSEAAMQRLEALHLASKGQTPPPLSEEVYNWLAMLYERYELTEKFDTLMQEAVVNHPDSHNLKNTLAYTWAERGVHLEEALKLSQQALSAKPDSEAYLDTKGWLLFKLNRPHEALQTLLQAAELNTTEPEILDHVGTVLLALGHKEEAIDIWQRSYSFYPDPAVEKKLRQLGAEPILENE